MTAPIKHEVWLWFLAAAGGLAIFLCFYNQAFPTASVDLSTSRSEARSFARHKLRDLGFTLRGYQSSTIFDVDSDAVVYLQRQLGMRGTNAAIHKRQLPVWYWAVRWFRSHQTEEYEAWISPSGKFWGFQRTLADDAAGGTLTKAAARTKAKAFLRKIGVNLDRYDLVNSSTQKQKNRTDHTFEWKLRDFNIAEAQYRVSITVQGNTVGSYQPYIKVPETFERSYKDARSKGALLAIISILVTVILFGLALMVFVQKYKAGELRWRFALSFAFAVLIVGTCSQWNLLGLVKAHYDTAMNYDVFIASALAGALMLLALYALFILLTGASGEALTREIRPESVQPLHDLIAGRMLTPRFATAAGRGYLAAMIMLGYLTAFYLLGQKFLGVWTAPTGPYSNMFNTTFPFLLPLSIGLMAAISEEFTFRLFAVSIVKKYLKRTFPALLIPALVWGFAHSTYPVFPIYVRGIELTIVGLFLGYLFLRYDILTTLIAHYAFDAFLIGMPLLISNNDYFRVSGWIVVLLGLLPVFPAVVVWARPGYENR